MLRATMSRRSPQYCGIRILRFASIVVASIALCRPCFSDEKIDSQSSMFRGNPARTGYYPGALGHAKGNERLKSILYVGSTNGRLYALNPKTGEEAWSRDLGYMVLSSPVVVNGVVYVGTSHPLRIDHAYYRQKSAAYMCALDAITGNLLWKVKTGRCITSSPAIIGETAYIGDYDGFIYALNIQDGKHLWQTKVSSNPLQSSIAATKGLVYGGAEDLVALEGRTGKIVWRVGFTLPSADPRRGSSPRMYGSPAVVEGVVYLTTSGLVLGFGVDYEELVAVDAATGKNLWIRKGRGIEGSAAVSEGIVYVASHDFHLYAIRATTGEDLWNVSTGPRQPALTKINSTPVVDAGVVYVRPRDSGNVSAFDAKSGKPLKSLALAGLGPSHWGDNFAVADNVLFTGMWVWHPEFNLPTSDDSPFYAVDIKSGRMLWKITEGVSGIIDQEFKGKGGFFSAPVVADYSAVTQSHEQ
jgi:outer membrane protein assembly factor BamB